MNIACYSHYFTPEIGAPSARIHDLGREWLAMGHGVQVVTCYPNHPTGRIYEGYRPGRYMRDEVDGIVTHRHWTYVTPNKGFVKKTLGHVSFMPGARLFTSHRLSPPDVVIGTSPTLFAAQAARSEARRRRIPFVMEIRDLWPAIFVELGVLKNPFIIKLLEKWEMGLYRAAARIVTVTESFRANLIERGIPPEKVATITNGADVDFWRPSEKAGELRARLGLEGRFVALYIGAHGISQALGRIVDAAARLKGHPDIRFVFVGEGAEKEELLVKARQAGVNILFHDPVDKEGVKAFYTMADVCLVPLRNIPLFDTFIPSKMFEIMAMSRPIIGSVRGEAAGILKRSGAAEVVNPEDGAAIAQSVLELYGRPERRAEMGLAGRRFVENEYSRTALARKYLDVLSEAVGEKGARP